MKTNIGKVDRIARILLGTTLLALGWIYQSPWGLIGLVPLLTGVIRFCPLYPLVGLNTCEKDR